MAFDQVKVADALRAFEAGEIVVVTDDDDRENEGDLIVAAVHCTAEKMAFIIRHTSGIVCAPMTFADAKRLNLAPMVAENDAPHATAFTVSVDYRHDTTTGISAEERTSTCRALANPNSGAGDFVRPGHIFPLVAKEGGVLMRSGHTEAAVDLCRLSNLPPIGVISELMNEDGTVMRGGEVADFAEKYGLKTISVADLIAYRRRHDNLVRETLTKPVTSAYGGEWIMRVFTDVTEGTEHVVLTKGDITTPEPVLVRTHALNVLEDVLALGPSPEGELARAMRIIAEEGRGAVCLFRDPKAKLLTEEEDGPRTIKQTGLGAQILSTMGLKQLILLTDSPLTRYLGLDAYDLHIAGTRPITKG